MKYSKIPRGSHRTQRSGVSCATDSRHKCYCRSDFFSSLNLVWCICRCYYTVARFFVDTNIQATCFSTASVTPNYYHPSILGGIKLNARGDIFEITREIRQEPHPPARPGTFHRFVRPSVSHLTVFLPYSIQTALPRSSRSSEMMRETLD